MFGMCYSNRPVLVTGHTGFKGSWLCHWLEKLGAHVFGYALLPGVPSHYNYLRPCMESEIGDIRDKEHVQRFISAIKPEIVFHLAAQPLVLESYRNPLETFHTNAMGTANLLEACRNVESIRAIVVITTDKCYENNDKPHSFKEEDALGGHDPYSASKAAAEIIAASYNRSFFIPDGRIKMATARAGNVIGGGDWAEERLIPDLVRSVDGAPAKIRHPNAIRPWQHVLEAISGYLILGQKLASGDVGGQNNCAFNFGPLEIETHTVIDMIRQAQRLWVKISYHSIENTETRPEAARLALDCSKAVNVLGWHPVWDTTVAIEKTINWYRELHDSCTISTDADLTQYIQDARASGQEWCL